MNLLMVLVITLVGRGIGDEGMEKLYKDHFSTMDYNEDGLESMLLLVVVTKTCQV